MTPRVINGIGVLDVAGELDLYTSPNLKASLERLIADGHTRLVVNLLETTYLDSTALAILSSALQELQQAGGNLGLVYSQPQLTRLFTITGLHDVFPTFASEDEALQAARGWTVNPPSR